MDLLAPNPIDFEFKVILLDCLPTKCREPSVLCYLAHSWEKIYIHTFPEGIYVKTNAENASPIPISSQIAARLHLYPHIDFVYLFLVQYTIISNLYKQKSNIFF